MILTAGTFGTINASPWFNLGIAAIFVALGAGDVRRVRHRPVTLLRPVVCVRFAPVRLLRFRTGNESLCLTFFLPSDAYREPK